MFCQETVTERKEWKLMEREGEDKSAIFRQLIADGGAIRSVDAGRWSTKTSGTTSGRVNKGKVPAKI